MTELDLQRENVLQGWMCDRQGVLTRPTPLGECMTRSVELGLWDNGPTEYVRSYNLRNSGQTKPINALGQRS